MRIGLREANQQFSKAIKAVKAGKEVVLTERGKPIAVIKPLKQEDNEEAMIRRLEAEGILCPALKRGPMADWKPVRIKGKPVSETIREERDEDRWRGLGSILIPAPWSSDMLANQALSGSANCCVATTFIIGGDSGGIGPAYRAADATVTVRADFRGAAASDSK